MRGRRTIINLVNLPGQKGSRKLKVPGGTRRASRKISADTWFRKRGDKGRWW